MKMRIVITLILSILFSLSATAQMQVENLNRGLVAVRQNQGFYLKWRLLGNESYNTSFNVYRGTTLLNDSPITDVTSYTDANAPLNSEYTVRAVVDGNEQSPSRIARMINSTQGSNAGYFDIELQRPSRGQHGGTYSPNDASVGDLTGDGEYEIVLMWDPSNSRDPAHNGTTDNVILDGITLEGELLWRINLGPNVRASAHETHFLVADFDGNGRSEIMVKTAPGTRDGSGSYISMGPASNTDHSRIYRNSRGYILDGPQYVTVFDGMTGNELATDDYWPARGRVADWGDSYGNRVSRFNATVAYLDGQRPSAIFQRGYYTRLALAAWDWREGQLTRRWRFDSDDGNREYRGQGNHSIHVVDANNNGRHDIVTGSAVIGSDGRGMHTSGRGHGDATHVTHMIKDHPTPQIFMPYESGGNGVSLRHASDGRTIFHHRQRGDIGRGVGAELDPQRPGFHFWASDGMGLYDITGTRVGRIPSSINFVIWWDGNLSRELMNSNTITRWSIANERGTNLLTGTGASSINGTKSTPVLQVDLFGDWREEVILRRSDDNALRVYTTTMPTEHKLYTFMHDPVYRVAISWQNSTYNQPPHPGFYVATDMDFPPPTPNVYVVETGIPPPPPPPPGNFRGSGNYIDSLIVLETANSTNWNIIENIAAGQTVFGDRDFTITSIPDFAGSVEWISTAMNSRTTTGSYAYFTAKETGFVYIAHSSRVEEKPQWLSDYTITDMEIIVQESEEVNRTLNLYRKAVSAGEIVELGTNSNDATNYSLMYLVLVTSDNTAISDVVEIDDYAIEIHPNPFNPVANITYAIKKQSPVELKIFNINGELVEQISKGVVQKGVYTAQFDGSNLASGVYFVRLSAGNKMLQKKMILLK